MSLLATSDGASPIKVRAAGPTFDNQILIRSKNVTYHTAQIDRVRLKLKRAVFELGPKSG